MNVQLIPFCALSAALTLSPGIALGEASPQEQARAAVQAFSTALKGELMTAMQAGGPLAAIEVCHSKAPGIAEAVSLEQGMQLSRVSLKNRNPDNSANEWQAAVLMDFQERVDSGEDAAGLSWQETAETGDGAEYRFMKAIPTGAVCLACHGKVLAPEVAAQIESLYPEDKATGFSEGDLRGAFVVTKSMGSE
jgi:hypothetical protein